METRKLVFHETAIIAAGELICVGAMIGVYALLGRFDTSVLLGGIAGMLLAVLNFFFMAVNACLAADKAVRQDVAGGKKQIKLSYTFRVLVMFIVLFACVKSGLCDALASVLPLVFVRPIITVAEFFRKKD